MNARFRQLRFGLKTLLSNQPQGFFVPYRYANRAVPTTYEALNPLFEEAMPRFEELIEQMSGFADAFDRFGGQPPNPRFEQDWFPRLDAAAAYTIVRTQRPARILEIGSGHSTRIMSRAIQDSGDDADFTCIDPAPRARLMDLPVNHIANTLQTVSREKLPGLTSGDILFVDSSHIAMPGTDVDFIVNTLLPGLPRGCLLHIHDIFLPDSYPPEWAWRGYNEQTAVSALIQSGAYEIMFASHYIASHQAQCLRGTVVDQLPIMPGAIESSLWLRKLGDAYCSANQNVSGR